MHWCKPYLPNWFNGQALQIINDKESLEFLKKSRDAIFYEWKECEMKHLGHYDHWHKPTGCLCIFHKFKDEKLKSENEKQLKESRESSARMSALN